MTRENNKKGVNSVPYTKAGLLNKSKKEPGTKAEGESNEPQKTDISENTPTISKEKSTERGDKTPLH